MDPKQMQNAAQLVKAGMKILYAPQMKDMLGKAVEHTANGDPLSLATNVVGIIKIVFDKAQGKIPPAAIPIATVMLIYEFASFVGEVTGEPIPVEVIKQAIPIAMELLKKVFDKQINGAKQPAQPGAEQPQAPAQEAAPQPQPAQPQQGMINQPMMQGA